MSTRWPELTEENHGDWPELIRSALFAALGGGLGWALFYLGLGIWGLAVGVALVVLAAGRRTLHGTRQRLNSLVLSLACSLLIWPPLWLAAVIVRYWITGRSVGM